MDNNQEFNEEIDWDNLIPDKKKIRNKAPRKADGPKGPKRTFWHRLIEFPHDHPIIFNIILIFIAGYVAVWLLMAYVGKWTNHGVEVRVPDVKELPLDVARATLDRGGFHYEVIDSVYEARIHPGSVVSQNPSAGSAVKPGRTVYLTVVASNPKTVAVPDFLNVSLRQAQASFEGLGIKEVRIEYLPSEYKDLVLGARINGRQLRSGERIPLTSVVSLEVGSGPADDSDYDEDEDFIITDTTDDDTSVDVSELMF